MRKSGVKSRVKTYCITKGVINPEGSALQMLLQQLEEEYGPLPSFCQHFSKVTIISVSPWDLIKNENLIRRVEGRYFPEPDFIGGIVVEHSQGYRLLDGYHRVKGLCEAEVLKADFLLLQ